MGSGDSVQLTTRPSLARAISPASSRTRRCFMKAGRDMAWGRASALTDAVPRSRSASTCRRVPSARAEKMLSSVSLFKLTIRLSIRPKNCRRQAGSVGNFPRLVVPVHGRLVLRVAHRRVHQQRQEDHAGQVVVDPRFVPLRLEAQGDGGRRADDGGGAQRGADQVAEVHAMSPLSASMSVVVLRSSTSITQLQ
ncbi:hypothetical protein G6F68_015775 [Rhizopus microsporus]|nr:hypothetical protein G6F68_015775 [Rhizopus microsporus]